MFASVYRAGLFNFVTIYASYPTTSMGKGSHRAETVLEIAIPTAMDKCSIRMARLCTGMLTCPVSDIDDAILKSQ